MENTLIRKYSIKPSFCLLSLLLVITVGCTTPDVKPFAESTVMVVTGFKVGGAKAVTSLDLAGESGGAAVLENELKVRYDLLDALLIFSVELAQIQSDSDRSKASVRRISSAASQLAITLSSGFSAPVAEVANKLMDEALEIREFHLISKALKEIEPHIEDIAKLLEADIKSFRKIYNEKMAEAYDKLENTAEDTLDEDLEARIESLRKEIAKSSPDPQAVSVFSAIYPVWKDQQQKIESLLEDSRTIRMEQKKGDPVYASVETAIGLWLKAYKDLAFAFEENRQVNLTELYLKAQEIKTLIGTI